VTIRRETIGNIKVQCPKCKTSFWADEWHAIICPHCGYIVKK